MNEIPFELKIRMSASYIDLEGLSEAPIFEVYKRFHNDYGRASCGLVADWMNDRGYKTKRGNPLSRMTVWRALTESKEGLNLLARTKRRTGHS